MARRAIGPFGVVEPAGHAKMQGKPRAAAQLDQQMLAVPPGRVELATLEPGAQAPGRQAFSIRGASISTFSTFWWSDVASTYCRYT